MTSILAQAENIRSVIAQQLPRQSFEESVIACCEKLTCTGRELI
jgi:hypothetical protein